MSEKIYFPNLNSFRFIAAALVLIHHVELFLIENNKVESFSMGLIKGGGQFGVTFFFVLSGFLITFLLFREDEMKSSISIKNFYIRRVLRIWPLYYLILIFGFFIIPKISIIYSDLQSVLDYEYNSKLFEYILFVPNYTLAKLNIVPFSTHLWSIGVEEQFYLIWPLLIKFFKSKIKVLFSILLIMLLLKSIFYLSVIFNWNGFNFELLRNFLRLTRFECMAIGGIAAYVLYYRKNQILELIFNFKTQYITLFVTLVLIVCNLTIPFLHNYIYSILFAIIILNAAGNKKSIINLEYKLFNNLGKISYGLYMYHPICIVICFHFISNNFENILANRVIWELIIILSSFILTTMISILSYNLFEKKIMKLKPYFIKNS